jgi:hypothetical protein
MTAFDRFAALANSPVNRQTRKVIGGGAHHAPPADWAPESRLQAAPEMEKCPPGEKDMTGVKFNRLTVLGFLAGQRPRKQNRSWQEKGPVWVCRCVCGHYTRMRSATILRGFARDGQCSDCHYRTERLPSVEFHSRTGRWPNEVTCRPVRRPP